MIYNERVNWDVSAVTVSAVTHTNRGVFSYDNVIDSSTHGQAKSSTSGLIIAQHIIAEFHKKQLKNWMNVCRKHGNSNICTALLKIKR